jgi:pyruvate formate lyase activating enzyme
MRACRASVDTFRVGGFVPFSTVDFPGKLAAVVFCQGCPWRCSYCHNTHLQSRRAQTPYAWRDLLAQLSARRGLLDAVVFSGGEPTAQVSLPRAAAHVHGAGFRVGLHTAGVYPDRLEQTLPLLDWVGIDIKTVPTEYASLTGAGNAAGRAWESLRLILTSGVDYEVRTTVHPDLITARQLRRLALALAHFGVRRYALQAFRPQGCDDGHLARSVAPDYLTPRLGREIGSLFEHFEIRRG